MISVQPDLGDVLKEGVIRNVAPRELTLVFNEQQLIDPDTLDGIRVIRAGFDNVFDGISDIIIEPGYIGVEPLRPNEVMLRFSERLPDDRYRIEVLAIDDEARGFTAIRNIDGDLFSPSVRGADRTTVGFELDLGPQVVAVVPQPMMREETGVLRQARDRIDVYFNDDDLDTASAENRAFYELIFTNTTVDNTDDQIQLPASVSYDPNLNKSTLTFESSIEDLTTGVGVYRLRIGSDEIIPDVPVVIEVADDPGSSFDTANKDLGLLRSSRILSSAIDPQGFPLDFPGAIDEPGHRDIIAQSHFLGPADPFDGIQFINYNFKEIYSFDTAGNPLFNAITENQKERARDIVSLYAHYLGVEFAETEEEGFTIVTGNVAVLGGGAPEPSGLLGIAGLHPDTLEPMVIMDRREPWDDGYGETVETGLFSWMHVAMHEIGHLLWKSPVLEGQLRDPINCASIFALVSTTFLSIPRAWQWMVTPMAALVACLIFGFTRLNQKILFTLTRVRRMAEQERLPNVQQYPRCFV